MTGQPPRIHNEIYPFLHLSKFRNSLKGQVVLITGALGTIAGAVAESFTTAGASLFLSDIRASLADSTKERLLHLGADAVHYSRCDIGNPKDCKELVKQATSTVGEVNVLINGAIQAEVDKVVPSSDIHLYAIHPGAVRSGMSTADGQQDTALKEFPEVTSRFAEWKKKFTGSPHLVGMSCVALATGIAKDALKGRYYDVEQDLEDVIDQAPLLKADSLLHTLHISMLGSMEREEGAMSREPEESFDFPGF
ncbi:hypothetical protein QWA68_015427 [Fusarium oxysporum]|nr:hypothetical protein QWA68_015427 [Fusarium oxysporum]